MRQKSSAVPRLFASVEKSTSNSSPISLRPISAEAVTLAQSMRAKAWELRATMSLARLLDSTSRRAVRAMLAEIYGRFTESFDTADLDKSKTLLDE
jgi:hypothetical protein